MDTIVDLGCHFLAQVKGNSPGLLGAIRPHTALVRPMATSEPHEKGHGREGSRRVELFRNEAALPKGWNNIERLVKVRRWGARTGKPYEEVSFFVLSKPLDSARIVGKAVRGHWGIENGLHWTKDVLLGEDDMSMTHANAATNVGFLNTLALNILKMAGHKPIKDTFAKFTNKIKEPHKLFQKSD